MTSVVPPAEKGTTKRIGRLGKAAARAPGRASAEAAARTACGG